MTNTTQVNTTQVNTTQVGTTQAEALQNFKGLLFDLPHEDSQAIRNIAYALRASVPQTHIGLLASTLFLLQFRADAEFNPSLLSLPTDLPQTLSEALPTIFDDAMPPPNPST